MNNITFPFPDTSLPQRGTLENMNNSFFSSREFCVFFIDVLRIVFLDFSVCLRLNGWVGAKSQFHSRKTRFLFYGAASMFNGSFAIVAALKVQNENEL